MTRRAVAKDIFVATNLTIRSSAANLATSWILVPLGVCAMLAVCFAVDTLFRAVDVAFPASVACLLLLFFALLGCELVLGTHRTRKIVAVIDVPASWSLRWINVFFTPAFVLLPLSPSIGVVEVFKIIAVFVFGFFVMMASAAFLTRGLQLLIGSSKRAYAERADELSPNDEDIPLAAAPEDRSRDTSLSSPSDFINLDASSTPQSPPQLRLQQHHYDNTSTRQSLLPLTAAPEPNGTTTTTQPIRRQQQQSPPPPCRSDIWAAIAKANIDLCTYAVLFLFVGLPIYYTTGYAMPAQLTANILCYFAALAIPAHWRQYLHPVLVSSLLTVLLIWPLAAIKGDSLPQTLHEYKTGANYLRLWAHATGQDSSSSINSAETLPGAGDVLSTVLDASIVSLSLPMFQYRRELRDHFTSIIVPNVVISLASLLSYPPLCVKIGISAERSLAFSSRSLTLALATPATKNLGGDLHTVAALAIVSGIMGVLVGQRILAWLRIPEDDYVTRGVTLGVNSSAIATALLLKTDPRAAALSSLSMTLFGTVTVLFTSIPPAATLVRSFVGL